MSAHAEPAVARPRGTGDRILRAVILVLLVIVGLVVGAIAGLFVAGALGWVPNLLC